MTGADFLKVQEPPLDPKRAKAFEAAFTPYPLAVQTLRAAAQYFLGPRTRRRFTTIDPSAGAGVWCQALRQVFHDPYVFAVEARHEEECWLRKNADEVELADFLALNVSSGAFDILATNPPFSLFAEFAEEGMRVADECWLYAPCDISMRSEDAAKWMVENQRWIAAEFTTPGPISFTGDGKTDFRHYSLWCLSRLSTGPCWRRQVLPMLPSAQRRWRDRPGTVEVPA